MAVPYSRYIIGNLPWYSVLMVTGILTAYLLGTLEEKRLSLPRDSMLDMVLVAVPSGIIGARLYYVVMQLDQFAANPITIFYIWEGGIAIYGSLIGGAVGVAIYCRVRKRNFASLLDITAPGLALAQAIGRWGNYFNREAFGPVITDPNWRFFPAGVVIDQGGVPVWHVATFFYESVWDAGVFLILWLCRKRMKRTGDTFLWYLVLYGCGRFLVEQLRQDSLYLFGFRASQYLSLVLCAIVAVVFLARIAKEIHGRASWGAMAAAALAFGRVLAPAGLWGTAPVIALYALCLWLLRPGENIPRFAFYWVLADLLVYVLLLFLQAGWLWQSPYFVYAGLSVPPYFAIAYAQLRRQSPPNNQPTASEKPGDN